MQKLGYIGIFNVNFLHKINNTGQNGPICCFLYTFGDKVFINFRFQAIHHQYHDVIGITTSPLSLGIRDHINIKGISDI